MQKLRFLEYKVSKWDTTNSQMRHLSSDQQLTGHMSPRARWPASVFYKRRIQQTCCCCCCCSKWQTLWFSFLLLNLTPVMKLGLLCFSHYLFIKDMTRKWGCHGDGSAESPSRTPSCIVYSFAQSAVFNGKRRLFSFLRLHLFFFPFLLWIKQWPANRTFFSGPIC